MKNYKYLTKILVLFLIICGICFIISPIYAHHGRNGTKGENNYKHNNNYNYCENYYYCDGHEAHLHNNGICPYGYNTNENVQNSNSTNTSNNINISNESENIDYENITNLKNKYKRKLFKMCLCTAIPYCSLMFF